MSYRIVFVTSARKEFLHLPADVREDVSVRIEKLDGEPYPSDAKALAGNLRGCLRIRVRTYRVVYQVDDASRLVRVIRVRHRGRVYR